MTSRWAAVVVNYESGALLQRCLASIAADASAGAVEVVVVDNGSVDGSVDRARAECPDLAVVVPGANLGYAAAANRGAAATRAPIVAVCNADVELAPGTAAAMVARLEREPDVGAAGPMVLDTGGNHYPSARSVPRLVDAVGHGLLCRLVPNNRFTRRYRQLDADPAGPRDVDWVSGAAVWLRRDALDAVGGWDERYFMYVEDVDLCQRLRGAGWRIVYEPGGSVTHVKGASTDRRPYRMIVEHHRSLLRFARRRWRGPRRALLVPAAGFLAARAAGQVLIRSVRPRRVARRSGVRGSTG